MTPKLSRAWPFVLRCAVVLFWCWNTVFICSTLPMMPAVPLLLQEWWLDDVPFDYVFILLAWMVLPWLCVVLARTRLRGRPEALAFLFFAEEGPFYCLCLYRLAVMRELTPSVIQWLAMAALGLGVYCLDTLIRPLPRTRVWHALRLMASTGLALAALLAGALVLLAWSPVALRGAWELLNPGNWLHALQALGANVFVFFAIPLASALVLLTGLSLLAMPLCMAVLCLRACVQAWQHGPLQPRQRAAAVLAVLVLQGLIYAQVNHQPQREAFALLASPTLTPAQFQDQQDHVRAGLLNAYLGAYRYASSHGESTLMGKLYRQFLGLSPEMAAVPQAAFNALAKPLLYDGDSLAQDATRAAALYEQFFDTPIQRGERRAIAHALSATYNREERESGLLHIDQRKVWVAEQRVQVQAQGDLASITLDETYVNQTDTPQEIFYLFSLPESAAITGLWLGTQPDALQPYTIATRGAAQRVYKAEVNRRIDPALLEQVGPRQYRLRAFPVPPRPRARGADSLAATEKLYLRLQYTTLASQGAWPLPVLAEKRNVAWDRHTQRSCNGGACPGDLSTWWPRALPMQQPAGVSRHAFRIGDIGDQGPTVVAQAAPDSMPAIQGKKVTLVLDRSWSMATHRSELLAALHAARQQMAGNTVSVLLTTTSVMRQAPRLLPLAELRDEMLTGFMGGTHTGELLQQAAAHIPEPQDLLLVLTDSGAFDLQLDKSRARIQGGMLSLVHLGGAMAPAYDDATLASVQSSGGSAFATLQEAWAHFAHTQPAGAGFLMQREGYVFTLEEQPGQVTDAAFAPVAARLFIAHASRQAHPLSVQELSHLHAVAQAHSVVTPYSSMLVLVNTQQQEALAQAEAADDRFDRAQEPGTQVLQKPSNPLSANATPEPEEWLLLLVSLCAAGWMVAARRRAFQEVNRPLATVVIA